MKTKCVTTPHPIRTHHGTHSNLKGQLSSAAWAFLWFNTIHLNISTDQVPGNSPPLVHTPPCRSLTYRRDARPRWREGGKKQSCHWRGNTRMHQKLTVLAKTIFLVSLALSAHNTNTVGSWLPAVCDHTAKIKEPAAVEQITLNNSE